jgi:hypothetical protein
MLDGKPFSTRAAYSFLHEADSESDWDVIWSSRAPSKVKIFTWLVVLDRLNSRANLHRKTIIDSDDCPTCTGVAEDCNHLFFQCPAATAVWNKANIYLNITSFNDLWTHHSSNLPHASVWNTVAMLMLCKIWDARNSRIFRCKIKTASQTISAVIQELGLALSF